MAGHLGTIWASVALDTAPLGAGAARARREMYALDATMNQTAGKSSASAGGIGKALLGVGSAATIMGGVVAMASYKMASEFDDAMHRVWSVSDDSRVAMEAWGSEILDLSTRFPESAKSMAEALYWIKSDMPDASDAEQFATLETALKGATGGVAELKDATEALVVVQNAYAGSGVELQGPTDYMDAMNMAVKRGSVTLQDFVANMGKAVGTAAMVKVPFTEIAAAAATLTKKGVPVETTFMALNQAMMTFLKPSKEASDLAQKLGIDFTLAGLRSKGLAGALMEIADKVPDDELANLFPNIRALKAVLPLAGVSVADFAKDLDEMGKRSSTTESMFKKNMDSMQNKTKVWFNAVKKPLIEFGTSLFPTVTKIGDAIARMFEGKNAVANAFFKTFKAGASIITSFAKTMIDFKGILLGVGAAFAAIKIAGFVSGIAGAAGAIRAAFGVGGTLAGVSAISQLSPMLGKISLAFATMNSGGKSLANTWSGVGLAFRQAGGGISGVLSVLSPFGVAASVATIAGLGLATAIKKWDENQQKAWDTVRQNDVLMGDLGMKLQPLVEKYENLRAVVGRTAEQEAEMISVGNQIADISPRLASGFDSQGNAIIRSNEALDSYVTNLLKYSGITITAEGPAGMLEGLEGKINQITEAEDAMGNALNQIQVGFDALGVDGTAALQLLQTDIEKGKKSFNSLLSGLDDPESISKRANFLDIGSSQMKQIIASMKESLSDLDQTYTVHGMTLNEIRGKYSEIGRAVQQVKGEMISAAEEAGRSGAEMPTFILSAYRSAIPEVQQAGVETFAAYVSAASEGTIGIEAAGQIAQQLFDTGTFVSTGVTAVDAALDAMASRMRLDTLASAAQGAANAVKEAFKGIGGGTQEEKKVTLRVSDGGTAQSTDKSLRQVQTTANKLGGSKPKVTASADASSAYKTLSNLVERFRSYDGRTLATVNIKAQITGSGPFTAVEYTDYLTRTIGGAKPTLTVGADFQMGDLEKAWATMNATALPTWSTARLAPGGDMSIEDWEHINEAIANLGGNVAANLTGWWGMNGALIEAEKSLKKYTAASEKAEERLDALQVKQTALNESLNKHKERLSELSQMKLKGEGKADDKSFAQTQAINKLELERLKIQQRARAGTATEADYNRLFVIAQKKQELELQQQIGDLQTSITYDPQRRQIEKLLDPLKGQEMTQKAITKAIKAEQKAIAEKERQLVKVEKQIKKEQAEVKRLRKDYDAAYKVVTDYSHKIDEMARNFLDHYQKMIAAQEELNRQMAGGSMGSAIPQYASGGPVVQDGLIYAHAGEYVLSRAAVRSFASLPRMNVSSVTQSSMNIYNFDNLTLPNVTDAESFTRELSNVNLRAQVS